MPNNAKRPSRGAFLAKLRKRRIIETLAAFIGGGWLLLEFVHWILVDHYRFPERAIDLTFVTVLGALFCTLIWRWFTGRETVRSFKPEIVLIPLVIVATVALDIHLLLRPDHAEPEAVPAAAAKNSIAVLPFDNISAEEGQDYFCEGLTDELMTRLSHLKELKVIAKTSAYSFKGKDADIREIGKKLGVSTILEGGVRKAGDRVRITAQLIDVSDGAQIWSDSYDRDLTDIFAIQDEIAVAVVDKLRLTLLGEEATRLRKRPAEDLGSYDAYLKGRFWIDRGASYFDRAKDSFEQAIRLSPRSALGYAGLASLYTYMGEAGADPRDVIPKAREAAREALRIDGGLAEAHLAMARIRLYYDWNWSGAEAEYLQAIGSNPNYAAAYSGYSVNLYVLKRFNEALEKAKKGEELDPVSSLGAHAVADVLKHMRRYDEAQRSLESALEKDPDNDSIHWNLWNLAVIREVDDDIVRETGRLMEIGGFPRWPADAREMREFGDVCRDKGWRGGLRWNLERMMRRGEQQHVSPYLIGLFFTVLGDEDEAVRWLEKAYSERDMLMPYLNTDPVFDPVRDNPRFRGIIRNMGFDIRQSP